MHMYIGRCASPAGEFVTACPSVKWDFPFQPLVDLSRSTESLEYRSIGCSKLNPCLLYSREKRSRVTTSPKLAIDKTTRIFNLSSFRGPRPLSQARCLESIWWRDGEYIAKGSCVRIESLYILVRTNRSRIICHVLGQARNLNKMISVKFLSE
jgi:hypothetical protein